MNRNPQLILLAALVALAAGTTALLIAIGVLRNVFR
jgi:hypothetical protein